MKIVVVGKKNFLHWDDYVAEAFKKLGHDVYHFQINKRPFLIKLCRGISKTILGKKIDSKVRQVGNFINPNNRTFKVEISIPNKDKSIKPNLTAKLRINDYSNDAALLIPQGIISENASGEQYIYVIKEKVGNDEAKAEKTVIKTGLTQGDFIEVTKGLQPGDEIILEFTLKALDAPDPFAVSEELEMDVEQALDWQAAREDWVAQFLVRSSEFIQLSFELV